MRGRLLDMFQLRRDCTMPSRARMRESETCDMPRYWLRGGWEAFCQTAVHAQKGLVAFFG